MLEQQTIEFSVDDFWSGAEISLFQLNPGKKLKFSMKTVSEFFFLYIFRKLVK